MAKTQDTGTEVPSDEILEMIKESNDIQTKAVLLILFRLSETLKTNTTAIEHLVSSLDEHREEFASHLQIYDAEKNTKKGALLFAQNVFLPFISIVQAFMIWFLVNIYTDFNSMKIDIIELNKQIILFKGDK